ncbi:MAG: hypothetical protein IKR21_06580 [Oscillospiraceae bacterium]|nr:hypothetical protein [Oscillospiraceae bacterium]
MLLLMDVSLFVPVSVMVMGGRSYTYGLIPAIIMAAYTTLRISLSVMNFKKSRKSENILVSELRMISFTDSLLAVLSLQNALIIASGGTGRAMMTLSAWTSAGILAAILVITLLSFAGIRKRGG